MGAGWIESFYFSGKFETSAPGSTSSTRRAHRAAAPPEGPDCNPDQRETGGQSGRKEP